MMHFRKIDRSVPTMPFDELRQHMLRALTNLFVTSPDEADAEAGATVRAIMQIAILLRTPVMRSAGGTLGAGGQP
jgi:hypothetical protein